jgi:tRNA pseudouridine55 synthase
MFGVLNINKPRGWSSRDVVNRVERLLRPFKAGHAGTLDPQATGVLLVCVGAATRLVEYAQRLPKEYRATFLLGRCSDTEDLESEVALAGDGVEPALPQLRAAAAGFTGEILQRPSRHSAIKVAGRRAYDLARKGAPFELPERKVTVYRLEVLRYQYPELEIAVECSAGTYIRALGRDLARSLGTCAVMASLERTRIGAFDASQAASVDELLSGCQQRVQSPTPLVDALPSVVVAQEDLLELHHGRPISAARRHIEAPQHPIGVTYPEIAALDAHRNLAAILRERRPGELWAIRNFPQPE